MTLTHWLFAAWLASLILLLPLWVLTEYALLRDELDEQAREIVEMHRGKPGWLVQIKDNRDEWVTDTTRYTRRDVAEQSANLYRKRGLQARLTDTNEQPIKDQYQQ